MAWRAGPPCRVRAGQTLVVVAVSPGEPAFGPGDVPVLAEGADYAAVAKPSGLHSAAIAHGGGESLEALLPALFPGRAAVLLSRLDRLTTGIVPVAFGGAAAAAYRRLEDQGRLVKTYLAVGHVSGRGALCRRSGTGYGGSGPDPGPGRPGGRSVASHVRCAA